MAADRPVVFPCQFPEGAVITLLLSSPDIVQGTDTASHYTHIKNRDRVVRLYILVKCCNTDFLCFLEGKTHFYRDHKDREIRLTTPLTNTELENIHMCTRGTNMREHVLSGCVSDV